MRIYLYYLNINVYTVYINTQVLSQYLKALLSGKYNYFLLLIYLKVLSTALLNFRETLRIVLNEVFLEKNFTSPKTKKNIKYVTIIKKKKKKNYFSDSVV